MDFTEFDLEKYKEIKDLSELKKSMFIQASAGTGKTYTITGIIKKLVKESVDLEKILVVTYTEKAAGELRDRIRKACPNKDVDNAPIFTIHSFCTKTLSEFSFTANQCANLSVIDEGEISDFLDGWIRDFLSHNSDFKSLFETAEKQDTFINNLKRDFKLAISKYYLDLNEKEVSSIVSLDTENFTFFLDKPLTFKEFDKITKPDSIEDLFIIDNFEDNWNYLEANLQAKKAEEFRDDILNNIATDHKFSFNGNSIQKRWVGEEIKETFDFFKSIKDNLSALSKQKELLPQINFYTEQVKKLYLAWQQEKEKNKAQSYTDMLRNVREAVCNKNSNLKKQLQKKYDFAIIDEFQDTNQMQWDIFKTVFMEDKDHTIIVVGDPKQSIYSFQGADVNVYLNATSSIAKNQGLACKLSKNFRSTDVMVKGCNLLFQNFFNSEAGINFSESKPSGTKIQALYNGKEIQPIWIAGNPDAPVTEEDFAKLTVQTIVDCCTWENGKTKLQVFDKEAEDAEGKCLRRRNVSFRDFAILVRSSSEFEAIEEALRKSGIPSLRYKDKNLFSGNECSQWISLFNAITADNFTGHNRTLLSEVLFTDFFGIPLEEVENEKYDNPTCPQRQMIIQWQQLAQQRKWAKLLEKIFADTNIENKLSQLDQMHSLTKIRQIGNYSVDYLYKTDSSLEDACKHLLRLSGDNDSSLEADGNIVERGTDFDSVQLMTIHASKGLEFPVVIVPAGLKGRSPNIAKAYLYHDKNSNNAKLSFSPYGMKHMLKEEDYERERIYYVAYTRASSVLMLPIYDIWDPNVSEQKAELHKFLKDNISSLFDANETDENGKEITFVKEVLDNHKDFWELKNEVQIILDKTKEIAKELNVSKPDTPDLTEETQRTASKELSKKIPELAVHKHSYVSLSHKKASTEEMTVNGGRSNKEGDTPTANTAAQSESLAHFDSAANPVIYTSIPGSTSAVCPPAAAAPHTYPKGTKLGVAIHEVFEKADFAFSQEDEGLRHLITTCFEKQTISIPKDDPDHWLTYTASLLWNTFNAKLPEIVGGTQTGNYFCLNELNARDRIAETEFNMNVASGTNSTGAENSAATALLKNYCNGFIDLVFKRKTEGKDIYSVLDWKSDSFEAELYSDGEVLKAHTDDRYSIQRVLYSYTLIKWLSIFYKDEYKTDTEAMVFENHFGGIYYVYMRGCQSGTCSGIYARTWKSWQELEAAFNNILKEFHIKG